MSLKVFHVYRNTPLGRETLRQAAHFAQITQGRLHLYVPRFDRFLLHFGQDAVEIGLDKSYLYYPESAEQNIAQTLADFKVPMERVEFASQPASNLPRLPTNFDILSLPRVMLERRGPLAVGALGSGVRNLVKHASGPALIAPGRFHEWQEILVLFGGSGFAALALQWGLYISQRADVPLRVLSAMDKKEDKSSYEKVLDEHGISLSDDTYWEVLHGKDQGTVLDKIPRTSLIVMGAYGHGRIYSKLFGSKTELVQRNTANLLMLVGEHCQAPPSTRKKHR